MANISIQVPVGVDPATARRALVRAMEEVAALARVEQVLADAAAPVRPGRLAQVAVREQRWRDVEDQWGMLSGAEVARLAGEPQRSSRSKVSALVRRQGLAGVQRKGGRRYPAFQFQEVGTGSIRVAPAWTSLRQLLEPSGWGDADVLAWAAAPNAYLEGRSPANEVQDHPERISDGLRYAVTRAFTGAPAGHDEPVNSRDPD